MFVYFLWMLLFNVIHVRFPNVLHGILRNIFVFTRKNYELIAGIKFENTHLHYELIRVTAVCTAHSIELILEVHSRRRRRVLLCSGYSPYLHEY
jgi:hypothetical protein